MTSDDKVSPIFVVGVQRSGTTLLRLLLDAHSQIAIPFESFVLVDMYHRLANFGELGSESNRAKVAEELLKSKGIRDWEPQVKLDDLDLKKCSNYADILDQVFGAFAAKRGKKYWGDKTPGNLSGIHVLYKLFPDAKFIHIIRDGRDVATSLKNQSWGPTGFYSALHYWRELMEWSRKMGAMLPENQYLEVKYEDLAVEPEQTLEEIMKFLELPFEKEVLSSYDSNLENKIPQSSKDFHQNIAKGITPSLAGGWKTKLSRLDKSVAEQVIGPLLGELGYERPDETRNPGMLTYLRKQYHIVMEGLRWRYNSLFRKKRK